MSTQIDTTTAEIADTDAARPRILFVDDSRMFRAAAARILGSGFDVVTADDGEAAWEYLAGDPSVQLVFTDLVMPGADGYELLSWIRSSNQACVKRLPVIVLTGSEDAEVEKERALRLGATDFISKPFSASELTARAGAHVRSEQSARRLRRLENARNLDPDTGLGNRAYMNERVASAMSFSRRHGMPASLVHLHVDGLRDALHGARPAAVTEMMGRIGRLLGAVARREDSVFRSGRHAFSFLLLATDEPGARKLVERLRARLAELALPGGEQGRGLEFRFAVQSLAGRDDASPEALIRAGLEGIVPAGRRARGLRPADEDTPEIDQALAMIANGEIDRVRPHLDQLIRRVRPLLRLAGISAE